MAGRPVDHRDGDVTAAPGPRGLLRFLPGVAALRRATPRSVAHDLAAGLVLSALLVPAGMAYAQASGLPPVTGLYATMIPMLAYALVGPSRILVLGPDSSLTALVAAVVVPLSHGDPGRAIALASLLSLIAGAMCVVAGLARFGFLTDLLSVPIRHGYLAGIAAIVIVGQLPRLCGFSTSADGLVDGLVKTVRALRDGRLNVPSLVVGLGGLAAVLLLRWWRAGFPGTLVVVIVATSAAVALHLSRHGVALVGRVPQGLPRFVVPSVDRSDWGQLLSAGFGIALVSFADSSVLSRTYAGRGGYPVDPDQELVAIGLSNMASGLFQGFSVSASASRTPVAESAGARSQLTGVFGAVTIAVLLIAAPTLLVDLPVAILASIVVAAALRLVDIRALVLLYRARRSEVVLSAIAFLGVAIGGAIVGVGLAVVVSLLNFVRKAWRPHTAELVRVDGLKGYHDADRHPEGRRIPGLLLFRFDAPLFFANADEFRRRVIALSRRAQPPIRRVVVTAEPITDVDATSALMLAELDAQLRTMGIQLAFAELKGHVRDALAPFGLVEGIGPHRFHRTVGEAVKSYLAEESVDWVDWEDRDPDRRHGAPWAYPASMTDKPSYIGLLNAIALGERRAAEYLNCWSTVTPDPDVRALLHTVALREAEHGMVFEKRLDELGYGLSERPDPDQARKMAVASSTTLCDREKLEQLKLCRTPAEGQSDVFDRFFQNKDIDPVTGGLLGRYIAEERDTGRRFAACHQALCEAEQNTSAQNFSAQNTSAPNTSAQNNGGHGNGGSDLSGLADQVAAVGRQLAELVRTIGTAASSGRA